MLLRDKVALVTGAGSGIGRAIAQLSAQAGAGVAALDIKAPGGAATVAAIHAAGGDAFFQQTDVGDFQQVERAVQATLDRYGRIDIIYSNAAAYALGSATDLTEAAWDRTLDVCLKATWMLAHCAIPAMQRGGGGAIVITGSVHSVRGYSRHVAYQAAKAGLLGLTRSLAADYAPSIRVNAVLPGAVETGLWDGISPEERARIALMCPLQRNGRPEDVAQAALFLASDHAAYITGTQVVVDGGLSAIIQGA